MDREKMKAAIVAYFSNITNADRKRIDGDDVMRIWHNGLMEVDLDVFVDWITTTIGA